MLELNQFRHSAFCLKVRMVLGAKKLSYRVVDIAPGKDQLGVFRKSGQRKVPVLIDGDKVIHDSSAIIRHLEAEHPKPKLIPDNPQQETQVHLIEDWADTTLAKGVSKTLLNAAALNPELRISLIPEELPRPIKELVKGLPAEFVRVSTKLLNDNETQELLKSIEKISKLIESSHWLVGDQMSLADIAVAAQLSLLRFPKSAGEPLAGKGCPGFSDHPQFQALFNWRDALEMICLNG
ncbi:glutathione S-transferase family protein [Prochlorococcus sp. MIT 1307]|uniref:glutathione S-transferase family protein n=1 Tax=Prochlorococcus sp. MIT 1307 TaxID=3096219 RepID=UPI002A74DFA0|nr:glutathione S-transferase family protein [Prochlorococcus sp. MIT 1307]